MEVIDWKMFLKKEWQDVSMSIGVFDGVHRGHQAIIERLLQSKYGLKIIVTFRQNPALFIRPIDFPGNIDTLRLKLGKIVQYKIGQIVLIDFSDDFSKLTGVEFVEKIIRACALKYLVLGKDFRCGHKGKTTGEEIKTILKRIHTDVELVDPVCDGGEKISSSATRLKIRDGKLKEAAAFLGRNFSVDLIKVPLMTTGSGLVFRRSDSSQVLPDKGSFPVDILYGMSRVAGRFKAEGDFCYIYNSPFEKIDGIEFN